MRDVIEAFLTVIAVLFFTVTLGILGFVIAGM